MPNCSAINAEAVRYLYCALAISVTMANLGHDGLCELGSAASFSASKAVKETPYLRAMAEGVSPAATVCVRGLAADGLGVTVAGLDGIAGVTGGGATSPGGFFRGGGHEPPAGDATARLPCGGGTDSVEDGQPAYWHQGQLRWGS